MTRRLLLTLVALCCTLGVHAAPKKVVLVAGDLNADHPRGTHEYEKSVQLIQRCFEASPNAKSLVKCEVVLHGWPSDPKTLDDADSIVLISSGGDRKREDHPLLVNDRWKILDKRTKRGCGVVFIHWTTFAPDGDVGERFLDWVGGRFDYEEPTAGKWHSKIKHATATVTPASKEHLISRGLKPFELREEFYYHIRFRPDDKRLTPILKVRMPDEADEQVVAWAVQREDGGRGFAFTGGHWFDNWQNDDYRRMLMNAIVWTAGAEVPKGGVASTFSEK
jgi:type 1 glutamine amidotransferase